jgi:hypothetical protein
MGQPLIVIEGDSQCVGRVFTVDWADIGWQARMALGRPVTITTVAHSGDRLYTTILTEGATQVDPLYSATADVCIAGMWAGVNDLSKSGPRTGAQAWGDQETWGLARKAQGFRTVTNTMLKFQGGSFLDSERLVFNALALANANAAFDYVVDMEPIHTVHGGIPYDGIIFSDNHLNATGYQIAGELAQSAYRSLLGIRRRGNHPRFGRRVSV